MGLPESSLPRERLHSKACSQQNTSGRMRLEEGRHTLQHGNDEVKVVAINWADVV